MGFRSCKGLTYLASVALGKELPQRVAQTWGRVQDCLVLQAVALKVCSLAALTFLASVPRKALAVSVSMPQALALLPPRSAVLILQASGKLARALQRVSSDKPVAAPWRACTASLKAAREACSFKG